MTWVGANPDRTIAGASGWTLAVRAQSPHWCTELWWATTTSTLGSVQATATRAHPTDHNTSIFQIYEVTGARAVFGNVWQFPSQYSDPLVTNCTVTVTPTASSSLVIGVTQYGDYYELPGLDRVVGYDANTTIDYQINDLTNGWGGDGGAAAWHMTNPTVAGVPVVLGVHLLPGSNSADTRAHSSCAIELLAQ